MIRASGGAGLAAAIADLVPVPLVEVLGRAELQTRIDRKYLLPLELLAPLTRRLADRYSVLEIDRRRTFRYSSTYFDTPELLTYHQHLQGRRRRYKVRTRSYLDSGDCAFEVKLVGARGVTVKRRMPYELARRTELSDTARDFLHDTLLAAYRLTAPQALVATATTSYWRVTLVERTGLSRLTCDADLVCAAGCQAVAARGDQVLIESKSAGGVTPADRLLRELGMRPVRVSKYCLAVAVLHPEVPANPWIRPLRRCFAEVGVR